MRGTGAAVEHHLGVSVTDDLCAGPSEPGHMFVLAVDTWLETYLDPGS
uniref:Uncharacterized protein n=1 Tax=Anguilla anguilla TaxID=7936 RepID=A0A0E9QAV8_ANGAN